MECLLATRSGGKIREIQALMTGAPGLRLLTLEEIGLSPTPEEDEVEQFHTFRENAHAKALFFARRTGLPTIADDSGIAVAALDGAPGVRSKRFAADLGWRPTGGPDEGDPDWANNQLLLQRLQGVPHERRQAHYACVAALATPHRVTLTTIGTCSGVIATEPHGREGFGYDPIFFLPELGATFAQISATEKNRRSHRARAFLALRAHLHAALAA
jgi:XTP/dITP diphosphohydrolase